jgi:hypothetical protein
LACTDIFSCLSNARIKMAATKALGRIQTERRTPTPTKMTFAGENTCQMHIRIQISQIRDLKHTRPTPSPRASEREQRTLTVGSSHLVKRSSVLRDRLSSWTCC